MRKVFTYSRKRPISSIASTNAAAIDSNKENSALTNLKNEHTDSPQTKRQKDIRSIMTTVDCKLSALTKRVASLSDSPNFSQYYKHKEWFLTQAATSRQDCDVSIGDLLKLLQLSQPVDFGAWFASICM